MRSRPAGGPCSVMKPVEPVHRSPAGRPDPIKSDLDWSVMKCLERDRQRRQETVNGPAARQGAPASRRRLELNRYECSKRPA